jgi:hypothetical protein
MMKKNLYFCSAASLIFLTLSSRKRKRRENQTQGAMGGRERALGGGFENGERKGKRD